MGFSKEMFFDQRAAEEAYSRSRDAYLDDHYSSSAHQSVTQEEETEIKVVKHWVVGFYLPDGKVAKTTNAVFQKLVGATKYANQRNRGKKNPIYKPIPVFEDTQASIYA